MRVSWLPLIMVPLITGCLMPRPWRMPATTACVESANPPTQSTMFMTLRLPDCGKGVLTRYRGEKLRFAAVDVHGPVTLYREGAWKAELARRVATDNNRPPVVFIHGYNNTNEEAVERSERIAGALGGHTVIALTWPSYGKKTGYFWDEANAEWSLDAASEAISQITKAYPGTIIVAHSMGSRLALRAIADLQADNRLNEVVRLILAAPDVDRDALARSWEGVARPLPVTMYVSRRDQALSASWRGHAYPRAGDFSSWVTGKQPFYAFQNVSWLEVVDTTDIDHTALGHAAFIEVPEGAIDLCRAIQGLKPSQRAVANIGANYFRIAGKGQDDDCRRNTEGRSIR